MFPQHLNGALAGRRGAAAGDASAGPMTPMAVLGGGGGATTTPRLGDALLAPPGGSGDKDADVGNAVRPAVTSGAAVLRFFGRRQEDPTRAAADDEEQEKERMARVYREIATQRRRNRRSGVDGENDDDDPDGAWTDNAHGGMLDSHGHRHSHGGLRRRHHHGDGADGSKNVAGLGAGAAPYQPMDEEEITSEYLDAVMVKPDVQVFNRYTRFFLDYKLESLYQEYTAVNWFGWARWHVFLWICVHVFVDLLFVILPHSGFERMDMFKFTFESVGARCQYIYLLVAVPFALLPNAINPFQANWRSWVCFIVIVFNFSFQMWMASANDLALTVFRSDVAPRFKCQSKNFTFNGTIVPAPPEYTARKTEYQKDVAFDVTTLYAGALVQILASFSSLFSFIFVISVRLEFVQAVVVGFTAVVTYCVVIAYFQLLVEWMTAVCYVFAVILLLILSHSSDRHNRRSFLSQLLVEKENASMKSYLNQAEAVLVNEPACEEEKKVVGDVLDNPEMKHLDMVRIPFADLKFLQSIGRGAMGDVIKAKYFGTVVVCKRMRRENITESAIISFREEIELMSSLRHPNIVQFIGASWDNSSNVCIVMEYLENGDMHSVLHSNIGRNFTWADPLLKMAIDAAQGMLYLHSQETPIVHRDLKSVNIFCSATFGCKVGDFGLSRRYKKDIDALSTLVGTPFWLAPEIIRNERYGPSADVFSFGIVLTELETRRTPYHDQEDTGLKVLLRIAENKLRPSLPMTCLPRRRQLILDCLNDDPSRRPTFSEILSRLQGPVHLEIEENAQRPTHHERRAMLRRSSTPDQSPPVQRRDYFYDIINNVHNPTGC